MAGLPAASHCSRLWPPFQARVVKPRISTLTPQRSSVRARMSALIAATVIGRPRIEPELSISSDTTVSRKLVSFSCLKDSGMHGIGDDAGQPRGIEHALVEVELPGAVLLRHQSALQAVGQLADHALQVAELLVEVVAQAAELLGIAQLVGLDDLVELHRIGVILLAQRLVAERTRRQPRTLGAARLLLVARAHLHLGLGLVGDGLGGVFLSDASSLSSPWAP